MGRIFLLQVKVSSGKARDIGGYHSHAKSAQFYFFSKLTDFSFIEIFPTW